jgi:hypothetical protein
VHRDLQLADLRRVGHGTRGLLADPARAGTLAVDGEHQRARRDGLNLRNGAHVRGLVELVDDVVGLGGLDPEAALRISADRKRLELVRRQRALVEPHVALEDLGVLLALRSGRGEVGLLALGGDPAAELLVGLGLHGGALGVEHG